MMVVRPSDGWSGFWLVIVFMMVMGMGPRGVLVVGMRVVVVSDSLPTSSSPFTSGPHHSVKLIEFWSRRVPLSGSAILLSELFTI